MSADKKKAYAFFVESRKACRLCEGLINPSEYRGGAYDGNHLEPWSEWQCNLDAELVVIGQDWGDTSYYQWYKEHNQDKNPSNKILRKLLASIGIEIPPPSASGPMTNVIFLTNALFCLKQSGSGALVKRKWFDNCGHRYLKPVIELVCPKVVVALGRCAYQSLCRSYGLREMSFRNAVEQEGGFPLPNGACLFVVYHCSPRVLDSHRSLVQQQADWQRVKNALGTPSV